jgi:hypothetical protein
LTVVLVFTDSRAIDFWLLVVIRQGAAHGDFVLRWWGSTENDSSGGGTRFEERRRRQTPTEAASSNTWPGTSKAYLAGKNR